MMQEEIDSLCSVCWREYDDVSVIPMLLPCQHHVCLEDLDHLSNKTCPECRSPFVEHLGPDRNLLKYLAILKNPSARASLSAAATAGSAKSSSPPRPTSAQRIVVDVDDDDDDEKKTSADDFGKIVDMYLQKHNEAVRIILTGDSGVGKTCLLERFRKREKFSREAKNLPPTTVGVFPEFDNIELNGRTIPVLINDTGGQERFRAITKSYYRQCDAVVIVFDVSDGSTFDRVPSWMEDVQQYARDDVIVMLVGTKADKFAKKRDVEFEVANKFAMQMGMHYVETSAFESMNVEVAFETVVKVVLAMKHRMILQEQEDLKPAQAASKGVQLRRVEVMEQQGCFRRFLSALFRIFY
eukprot:TRINITY_DN1763_c0_g1_i1.p1 TRINITY_DN1763_c0_g1~~TRINITY_DN1763_c0_g1_i1.p1  ORF type:complete len:354 (-),score=94.75 TRINITY_DN1763_c0_g1_i1:1424-2485(-)